MSKRSPGAVTPPWTTRRPRGFTLVELLVVLGIISVALTLATPSFRSHTSARSLRSATQEFSHMLSLARSRAVATGKFVAVEVDMNVYPTPDRLRILDDVTWNAVTQEWEGTELANTDLHIVESPNDFQRLAIGNTTFFTGIHALVFSPRGAVGVDDGSELGVINVDIIRMDA